MWTDSGTVEASSPSIALGIQGYDYKFRKLFAQLRDVA
jgi:hypothetical protein